MSVEIRQMLKEWENFLSLSYDAEVLVTRSQEMIYANKSACRLFYIHENDLSTTPLIWLDKLAENTRNTFTSWIEKAFQNPQEILPCQLALRTLLSSADDILATAQLISSGEDNEHLLRITFRCKSQQNTSDKKVFVAKIRQVLLSNMPLERKLGQFLQIACTHTDIKYLFIYQKPTETNEAILTYSPDAEMLPQISEQDRITQNEWKGLLSQLELPDGTMRFNHNSIPEALAIQFKEKEIEELYSLPITVPGDIKTYLGIVPRRTSGFDESLWEEISRLLPVAWMLEKNRQQSIEDKTKLDWLLDATELWTWEYNPEKEEFIIDRYWMIKCGYTENQVSKEQFIHYIHPNDRQTFISQFEIASETKNHHFETELRFRKADGEYQLLRCKGKTQVDYTSGMLKFIGIISEILSSSESSQEWYRQLFQLNPSYILVTKMASGIIVNVNQQLLDILGKTRKEIVGLNFFELGFISLEMRENLRYRLLRDNKIINEEVAIRLGDEIKFGLYNGAILKANEEIYVISSIQDITHLINNNKELKEHRDSLEYMIRERTLELDKSRSYYEMLIQALPDYVSHFLPDTTTLFVNDAYCRLKKQKREDIIGKKWIEHVPESQKAYILEQLNKLYETRKVNSYETHFAGGNQQSERWIQWIHVPIINDEGEITEIQATGRDITKIKQIQQELNVAKEKVEESDRLKSAFLANISHEVRTPMNVILGFSNLLIDDNLSTQEKKEFTEHITSNGNQLLRILDNILEISRIEAGSTQINHSSCQVNPLIKGLCHEYKPLAQHGVNVVCHTEHKSPLSFVTDKHRIRQLLTNLMDNAIKFTNKGYVEIGYKLHPNRYTFNQIEFYVEDTGIGIPADMIPVIFERFRQADSSSTRQYGGTGLGLSIAQKLAELLEGKLSVSSVPNEKTVFSVTFPIQQNDNQINNINYNTSNHMYQFVPDWQQHKVLIVEDVESNYQYIQSVLGKTGIQIIHASDGEEAIDFYQKNPDINLVLMDIKLPIMNGLDATQKLKMLNTELPVIAVTAYAMAEDKEKCMAAGCDDFIVKPINRFELLTKMEAQFEAQET